uniref:Hydroxyacid dehydrogenase n=1 Tax=Steinernema glaseri TaxID=37863 RepID=A0A1I7Y9U5_9BILA
MVSGMLSDELAIEKWNAHFTAPVKPFTQEERRVWLSKLADVVVSSDACFAFRDNIDCARQFGARFIACPSGTSQEILDACNEYGLVLIHTGQRFVHSS